MLRQAQAGQPVTAFTDRTVSPSYVPEVVEATLELVAKAAPFGLYNCGSVDWCSWADVAEQVLAACGQAELLERVPFVAQPNRAVRPRNCTMSSARLPRAGSARHPGGGATPCPTTWRGWAGDPQRSPGGVRDCRPRARVAADRARTARRPGAVRVDIAVDRVNRAADHHHCTANRAGRAQHISGHRGARRFGVGARWAHGHVGHLGQHQHRRGRHPPAPAGRGRGLEGGRRRAQTRRKRDPPHRNRLRRCGEHGTPRRHARRLGPGHHQRGELGGEHARVREVRAELRRRDRGRPAVRPVRPGTAARREARLRCDGGGRDRHAVGPHAAAPRLPLRRRHDISGRRRHALRGNGPVLVAPPLQPARSRHLPHHPARGGRVGLGGGRRRLVHRRAAGAQGVHPRKPPRLALLRVHERRTLLSHRAGPRARLPALRGRGPEPRSALDGRPRRLQHQLVALDARRSRPGQRGRGQPAHLRRALPVSRTVARTVPSRRPPHLDGTMGRRGLLPAPAARAHLPGETPDQDRRHPRPRRRYLRPTVSPSRRMRSPSPPSTPT